MSAFFLSINRDGVEFAPHQAQSMMTQLDRFGKDTRQLLVQDHYALGYQSLWTVPQELGEQQPLYDHNNGDYLMFNGRIDNRESLFKLLQLKDHDMSDAQLMIAFYQRYKKNLQQNLKAVIGPFVFVVFNPQQQKVVAARDAMGGRYLCFKLSDEHIHIATYEMAIVAHESVDYRINKQKAASALSIEIDAQPCSAIVGIEPLLPGHCLSLHHGNFYNDIYYLPDPKTRLILNSDAEYANEMRRLLDQAVARRLRSVGQVGCMLSGGLDSVPISISAAKALQENGHNLTAFSWVFDKYPEADERKYSSDICKQFDIEQDCINCDDVWPQFDKDMHINPIVPFGIPYSEFQQTALSAAQRRDITTVLTGIYGDHLYQYSNSIFFELLRQSRVRDFVQEFKRLWKNTQSRKQLLKSYVFVHIPGVKSLQKWRLKLRKISSNLLLDELLSKNGSEPHWLEEHSAKALRPNQYRSLLDAAVGEDSANGKYMEGKYNLERRYPFRDRELCEFMLAIPSDQLYFKLSIRPIVKRAYQNELTHNILNRNTKTSFASAINAGILADKKSRQWFEKEPQAWREYVKECYFEGVQADDSMRNIVSWRCGFYNYWKSMCYSLLEENLGKPQQALDTNEEIDAK